MNDTEWKENFTHSVHPATCNVFQLFGLSITRALLFYSVLFRTRSSFSHSACGDLLQTSKLKHERGTGKASLNSVRT